MLRRERTRQRHAPDRSSPINPPHRAEGAATTDGTRILQFSGSYRVTAKAMRWEYDGNVVNGAREPVTGGRSGSGPLQRKRVESPLINLNGNFYSRRNPGNHHLFVVGSSKNADCRFRACQKPQGESVGPGEGGDVVGVGPTDGYSCGLSVASSTNGIVKSPYRNTGSARRCRFAAKFSRISHIRVELLHVV